MASTAQTGTRAADYAARCRTLATVAPPGLVSGSRQQPLCEHRGLRATAQVELAQPRGDVRLDRRFADVEIVGDPIGRASCRERVCQYVEILVFPVSLKKKNK